MKNVNYLGHVDEINQNALKGPLRKKTRRSKLRTDHVVITVQFQFHAVDPPRKYQKGDFSAQCYKTFFHRKSRCRNFPQNFKRLSKTFNSTDYELNAILQYILAF